MATLASAAALVADGDAKAEARGDAPTTPTPKTTPAFKVTHRMPTARLPTWPGTLTRGGRSATQCVIIPCGHRLVITPVHRRGRAFLLKTFSSPTPTGSRAAGYARSNCPNAVSLVNCPRRSANAFRYRRGSTSSTITKADSTPINHTVAETMLYP